MNGNGQQISDRLWLSHLWVLYRIYLGEEIDRYQKEEEEVGKLLLLNQSEKAVKKAVRLCTRPLETYRTK